MKLSVALGLLLMFSCTSYVHDANDAGKDYDYQDIEDATDIEVIDATDYKDVPDHDYEDTEDATDPYVKSVYCDDRAEEAVYYPWFYNSKYFDVNEDDGYKHVYDRRFMFNFETGEWTELARRGESGYYGEGCLNKETKHVFKPVRSIQYINNPGEDGIYGDWLIYMTDIETGEGTELDLPVQILSEDCLRTDLYNPNIKSNANIWKVSEDEKEFLLNCATDYGNVYNGSDTYGYDLYKLNIETGEITYLLKASDYTDEYTAGFMGFGGYDFQDFDSDYVAVTIYAQQGTRPNRVMVWNWRTGELVFETDDHVSGGSAVVTEDGYLIYNEYETHESDAVRTVHLKMINLETGEEEVVPEVSDNTLSARQALPGRPELITFEAGEGYLNWAPDIPKGKRWYYIWDRNTGIVRRLTPYTVSYGRSELVYGQEPAHTILMKMVAGNRSACYFYKDLIESGIMDTDGNLLPPP